MTTEENPGVAEPRWKSLPPGPTLAELKPFLGFLTEEDARLMREAIEEARRCTAEDEK